MATNEKDVQLSHHEEQTPVDNPAFQKSSNHELVSDQKISVKDALQHHPWALFWSFFVSMCVIMEGYDTILIPNFYAYPAFTEKFGHSTTSSGYQISAPWQAALSNAGGIGAFFGALLNGLLVNKFGYRKVVLGALIFLTVLLFIPFFSPSVQVLFVGELLCGLPWGIFATTAPAYASEILPLPLRVYLTSYTNMCFIIGQLIAAGVLEGLVSMNGQWSYRIPFALQWMWPALLIPVLSFAPESPWHLVRAGRLEEAKRALERLQSPDATPNVNETLELIVRTNALEQELEIGTSYWDCFKGFELRRTEIACMVFAGQILSGLLFAYNASYFFRQIGLDVNIVYKLSLGGNALALFATILSWLLLMPYLGRRTVYLWGMIGMTTVLLIIGILNVHTAKSSVGMTQAILTLLWTFMFQLSVGQLGWAIPAEVGSTRLRQKTVVLARNAYYIVSVIGSVLQPYFINPEQWNLKGYTGFVWGGTSLIMTIWVFFRLPETKGRTFEELDLLFAKRLPARRFKNTELDIVAEEEIAKQYITKA